MYKYEEYHGDKARSECAMPEPFGIGVTDPRIERLEIWATEFNDPGSDYVEFRMYDASGARLGTRRMEGY